MIIAISGLSGCGKNTIGEKVASKLKLRVVRFSFKEEARKRGMSLMEYHELASKDRKLDEELDRKVVEAAKEGNCVVVTWLGPWMVENADLRVWLRASDEERARRVSRRDRMSFDDAIKHVRERDENNRKRYKEYYGIDVDDHSIFDMEINTERFDPEQTAEIIVKAAILLGLTKYGVG